MALTEKFIYQVEITENDHVQVRTRRVIMEDGKIISSALHRHIVAPGQDYSNEIGKVRRMVAAAHIPTVVDKHQTYEAVLQAKSNRDEAAQIRADDNTPENQAAEAVAEQAILDAELAAEQAEAAHEAFLASEDT